MLAHMSSVWVAVRATLYFTQDVRRQEVPGYLRHRSLLRHPTVVETPAVPQCRWVVVGSVSWIDGVAQDIYGETYSPSTQPGMAPLSRENVVEFINASQGIYCMLILNWLLRTCTYILQTDALTGPLDWGVIYWSVLAWCAAEDCSPVALGCVMAMASCFYTLGKNHSLFIQMKKCWAHFFSVCPYNKI